VLPTVFIKKKHEVLNSKSEARSSKQIRITQCSNVQNKLNNNENILFWSFETGNPPAGWESEGPILKIVSDFDIRISDLKIEQM